MMRLQLTLFFRDTCTNMKLSTGTSSYGTTHCVKSVQIWSYFWSVFNLNTGKYGPEITSYLDTFHAVTLIWSWKPFQLAQEQLIGMCWKRVAPSKLKRKWTELRRQHCQNFLTEGTPQYCKHYFQKKDIKLKRTGLRA